MNDLTVKSKFWTPRGCVEWYVNRGPWRERTPGGEEFWNDEMALRRELNGTCRNIPTNNLQGPGTVTPANGEALDIWFDYYNLSSEERLRIPMNHRPLHGRYGLSRDELKEFRELVNKAFDHETNELLKQAIL